MILSQESLRDRAQWEQAGFALPRFDREKVREKTAKEPRWLHLGAGNIFRAFTANLQQTLLNEGRADTGLIVAEGFDYEIIERFYKPKDDLSILVTLKADGSIDKTVLGSIVESHVMDAGRADEWARLQEIFRAPTLQMVSFTITEKGYNLQGRDGGYQPAVAADLAAGPEAPASYIGKLVSLLCERFRAGRLPLALVSMDNCSHNGTRLHDAVMTFARAWEKDGKVRAGFSAYLEDPSAVSFTWSMIDKITPRPNEQVQAMLEQCGFTDTASVVTSKNTYVAPFVNSEEPQYLVIEDHFPNGHPPLEQAGVIFTDRETVDKVEKMKVCTCLNPLHTALAVFGCLLGHTKIADEMQDDDLRRLVERIGYEESLPVVTDPGILRPRAFLDEVLQKRFPNPFMPDTPQRIATDTSQKLAIRFGETIKAYLADPDKDVRSLRLIPLVLAGWCRYLLAVDDEGRPFTPSPDPMLETCQAYLKDVRLGERCDCRSALRPLLADETIFGVDLYRAGLAGQIETFFAQLISAPGAVRRTLHAQVNA